MRNLLILVVAVSLTKSIYNASDAILVNINILRELRSESFFLVTIVDNSEVWIIKILGTEGFLFFRRLVC